MTLPIIGADQRMSERRGVKGVLIGKSGIGKTSQLWTLDAGSTLFLDLEAGDLAPLRSNSGIRIHSGRTRGIFNGRGGSGHPNRSNSVGLSRPLSLPASRNSPATWRRAAMAM